MERNRFKKGQSYSIEIIFFVVISLIILYTLFSIYTTLIKLNLDENKYYIMTWSSSDVLIKTRGVSPDWEENGNLTVLGISNGMNVIDPIKLESLNSLSNENISKLMNLDIYNVSIEILINGNIYFQKGNVSANKTINQIERVCVFTNGTPCMLRVRYSLG
ncbi:MAG: hypothetical protein QXW67_02000 [Candidatus Micrarchaeia archaeon]